jgi:hypothetical protein
VVAIRFSSIEVPRIGMTVRSAHSISPIIQHSPMIASYQFHRPVRRVWVDSSYQRATRARALTMKDRQSRWDLSVMTGNYSLGDFGTRVQSGDVPEAIRDMIASETTPGDRGPGGSSPAAGGSAGFRSLINRRCVSGRTGFDWRRA